MKRCIIITGYIDHYKEGMLRTICPELFTEPAEPANAPLFLCADGGYRFAQCEGLTPHVIIGDFDTFDDQSSDAPQVSGRTQDDGQTIPGEIVRVPVMKDDTDTMLCIKYGLEQGCDDFLLIGGLGGRLDHTFANVQALAWLASRGKTVTLMDSETCVTMKAPGTFELARRRCDAAASSAAPYTRFSLFSFTPSCENITIENALYPLEHGRLEQTFPLGVSNEFVNETPVRITFEQGLLLIIMNR